MREETPGATFRDPAGSLSFSDTHAVRRISEASRTSVLDLLQSEFCRSAQARGDLIAADIDDSVSDGLRLLHPRIPVPTYPWEWTPGQWVAAAELTLSLGRDALAQGWILKDATPLNVLFRGTRPVFVDILSFERRDPNASVWLAYGQYVRTFLLPLLTHRLLHWPLALTIFRRDGYEPSDLYHALGWHQRLLPAALWPVTLPTLLERRERPHSLATGSPATRGSARSLPPEVATAVLTRTMNNLLRRTRNAVARQSGSQWSDYPTSLTHYTPAQTEEKAAWVRARLEDIGPARVLDIGANTGDFSAMAAELGADVVALERDQAAAERIFARSRERKLAILPVHADVARPTPAVGWDNAESTALLARLQGRFDAVLLLAVIHHLILMEQIPIPAIVSLLFRLTRRRVLLEWVPAEDPMFQSLIRGRDALYGSLTERDLLAACEGLFSVLERRVLGNGRVLLDLQKVEKIETSV